MHAIDRRHPYTDVTLQNVTLPPTFFKYFASKNQLPGLSISETLLEYGLILLFSPRLLLFQNIIVYVWSKQPHMQFFYKS